MKKKKVKLEEIKVPESTLSDFVIGVSESNMIVECQINVLKNNIRRFSLISNTLALSLMSLNETLGKEITTTKEFSDEEVLDVFGISKEEMEKNTETDIKKIIRNKKKKK